MENTIDFGCEFSFFFMKSFDTEDYCSSRCTFRFRGRRNYCKNSPCSTCRPPGLFQNVGRSAAFRSAVCSFQYVHYHLQFITTCKSRHCGCEIHYFSKTATILALNSVSGFDEVYVSFFISPLELT